MDQSVYQEYFELERRHWWFLARSRILRDRVLKLSNRRRDLKILNIGAATGATSTMLREFGGVVSVEWDKDCCRLTNEKLDLNIINGSITELPFPDYTFDMVCAFDVIEHVENDRRAACEMKRVCQTKGVILATVPAYMTLWSEHDVLNHHYRRYTQTSLARLFRDVGLTPAYKSCFNTILFPPILAYRLTSKVFPRARFRKRGSGIDNNMFKLNGVMNKLLYGIFAAERPLLRFMSFPFGVSIMMAWRNS